MSLLIFLVFSMILVSPKLTTAQNATIKIGALGPLAITPGQDMERGAKLAVKEINAAGGFNVTVGGAKVLHDFELILETTSGADGLPDATVAATSANKLLVTDEVVAALGGFRTEVVLGAIQPAFNTSKVPFMGVGSTAPLITEYFYRVGPVNGTELVRGLVAFYLFKMAAEGATEVTVVREDAAWAAAVSAGLKPTLLVGGTLGSANFTFSDDIAIVSGATGPDVATALGTVPTTTKSILSLFSGPTGKVLSEQWAATGMSADTYLAGINVEAQKNSHFIETGGAAAGEILFENAPPGEFPTVNSKPFANAYFAEYGVTPTYTSYASYDAVFLIKEAILAGDSFTSASIHTEMADIEYLGTSYMIKFTSENNWGQVKNVPSLHGFNNTIVHDLYTTATVGVDGGIYAQPYFSQWSENGFRQAVWHGLSTDVAVIQGPAYVPVTTVPSTVTSVSTELGATETVTGGEVTVTDTEDAPSFFLWMTLFSTIFVATYTSRVKRRKEF